MTRHALLGAHASLTARLAYREAMLSIPGWEAYWRHGSPSGIISIDEMGLHNGVYTGGPTLGVAGLLAGDPDTAMALNGTTQYVVVPYAAALQPGDTLSISTWIRLATGGSGTIISGTAGASGAYRLWFWPGDHLLRFGKSGGDDAFVSTSAITDTDIHNIVATKDGATCAVYLDGVPCPGTYPAVTLLAGGGPTVIGSDGSFPFAGTIDDTGLNSRAITFEEQAYLYRIGAGL